MSQISFSHQFSHRWLKAPQPVKKAIVQELDDIVQLLDRHTDLDSFEFTTPDLHQYIDSLYADLAQQEAKHKAEQLAAAQKEAEEELQQQPVLQEQQPPVLEQNNTESANTKDTDLEAKTETEVKITTEANSVTDTDIDAMESLQSEQAQTLAKVQAADTELTQSTTTTENEASTVETNQQSEQRVAIDETYLKELETKIDDYLSEQLTIMSDDIKAWLREQVNIIKK